MKYLLLLLIATVGITNALSLEEIIMEQAKLLGLSSSKEITEATKEEDKILDSNDDSFLDMFYLSGCRITQSSLNHIKPWAGYGKGGGGMYATDVACNRGESFNIKAPSLSEKYKVILKGNDNDLGDYIVLNYDTYYIVYGHTRSDLNVGDITDKGAIIGNSIVNGASKHMHAHIELWEGDPYTTGLHNIRFDMTTKNSIERSKELLNQRGWFKSNPDKTYEVIKDFIKKKEGLHLKSYFDSAGYSIGYGTKSYEGEVITLDEAEKRLHDEIDWRIDTTIKHFPELNPYQHAGLTSLLYNAPSCYYHFANNGINQDEWSKCNKSCIQREGKNCLKRKELGGLTKRRKEELSIFNKIND